MSSYAEEKRLSWLFVLSEFTLQGDRAARR